MFYTLYVNNLPANIQPATFRNVFDNFGIVKVYIPRDVYTGKFKTYGFIHFSTVRRAFGVIRFHRFGPGFFIGEQKLGIFPCVTYQKSPEQMHYERIQREGGVSGERIDVRANQIKTTLLCNASNFGNFGNYFVNVPLQPAPEMVRPTTESLDSQTGNFNLRVQQHFCPIHSPNIQISNSFLAPTEKNL